MPKHYVIIGGVAAGTSAAARLKRLDPLAQVTLLERSDVISYGTCEIPYVISGDISTFDDIVFFNADTFKSEKGVDVLLSANVHTIDVKTKTVHYRHGLYNSQHSIQYDKLLITTGASPIKLPVLKANNSFALKSLDSAKRLQSYISTEKPKHAVIVGCGFIGLEMVDALMKIGIRVSLIESADQILPGKIDKKDSVFVEGVLSDHQVQVYKNEKIKSAIKNGFNRIEKIECESGLTLYPDIIIQAVGFSPNTQIAGIEAIKKHNNGSIVVNSKMETSIKDIYAAGDCCVLKDQKWIPLATTASKMGRVAASSMIGKSELFTVQNGTFAFKLFDYEIAHTGMTKLEAEAHKLSASEIRIKGSSRAGVYPGSQQIQVQIVYDNKTGKLFGATIIGKEGAALRINTVSLALQNEMTVQQFREADFMYTPPFSPLWDPLLIAVNQIKI